MSLRLASLSLCLLLLLWMPPMAHASVDVSSGSWTSTFNCSAVQQFDAGWTTGNICDGISKYGDWTAGGGGVCATPNTNCEQITADANMAAGAGGKGQRHWIAPGDKINSGSMRFCMSSAQSEFWFRFYTRWETGFKMNTGQQAEKLLYSDDTAGRPYFDTYGSDGMRVVGGNCDGTNCNATSGVWNTMMGGAASDGNWHELQFHLKAGAAGTAQVWVDGTLVLDYTVNWGAISNWTCFKYPENLDSANNASNMYQDIDDMAISTTGYIASLTSSPSTTITIPRSSKFTGAARIQ